MLSRSHCFTFRVHKILHGSANLSFHFFSSTVDVVVVDRIILCRFPFYLDKHNEPATNSVASMMIFFFFRHYSPLSYLLPYTIRLSSSTFIYFIWSMQINTHKNSWLHWLNVTTTNRKQVGVLISRKKKEEFEASTSILPLK